jgi:hypothetical protein
MTRTALTIYLADPAPDALPPSPILVDDEFYVRAGLDERNGARLVGFSPRGALAVTVWVHQALRAPAAATGLQPSFILDGHVWRHPLLVANITVRDQGRIRVEITDTRTNTTTTPYSGDDQAVADRVAAAWGSRPGFIARILARRSNITALPHRHSDPTQTTDNASQEN